MFQSYRVVAYVIVGESTVVIPRTFSVLYLFQNIEAFSVISVLNIVQSRAQILIVLAFWRCLRLLAAGVFAKTAESAETTESAEAPRISGAAVLTAVRTAVLRFLSFSLPLIHYDLISLLNFLEFFFISFLIRVADVGVRMIFPA